MRVIMAGGRGRGAGRGASGREDLLVLADDVPGGDRRRQEVGRAAELEAVVVLVLLQVPGGDAAARSRLAGEAAAELLGEGALDVNRADRGAAAEVVDDERVGDREDRGLDRHVA